MIAVCEFYDNADVFVVLPGGFGTLDEMFEVITWRQIKIHEKLVVIYNHNGYWDHMITLMEHMVNIGFAKPAPNAGSVSRMEWSSLSGPGSNP